MSKDLYIDYKDHYNSDYWNTKKTYRTPDGKEHVYHNPSLAWDGFQLVVDALKPFIPGKTLLDIGCGGGDLARRFMDAGYDAFGIDISEFALQNCHPQMKERLALADITSCPTHISAFHSSGQDADGDTRYRVFPETFDVVMATDLLEHIYEEDLDKTFDWMLSKTNRWLFFCVATAQHPTNPFYEDNKIEFCHKKGQPIPIEFEATAISGHINVRHWKYWAKLFRAKKLEIQWGSMYMFQMARECDQGWRNTGGWNLQTTWLLEKK